MKYKNIIFLIMFLVMPAMAYADDIKKFKSIEFKGLNYLTKYEIINKINIKTASDGFVLSIKELENYLSSNKLISKFNLITENEKLVIIITENEPAYIFLLKNENGLVPFEIDAHLKLLSLNKIHKVKAPVIISEKDIKGNTVSTNVNNVIDLLNNVSRIFPGLYNQIREIDMTGEYLNIKIYGRLFDVIVKPTMDNFKKLNYSIGYFDSIGIYPKAIAILDGPAILR